MKINIGVLLIAPFILFGCSSKQETKNIAQQEIPVKVTKVELKELQETIDYVGDIKAWNEVAVYPKVSGKIIEKVKQDGDVVIKDEVVAYIDRDEVGLKFEKAPIESPLVGIVGRVYVDIGENVTAQTPIALIVDMNKVKINLDIPEKYLSRISLTQEAKISVDAYPKDEFSGQVTKISPVIDLITRTAPIELALDNPDLRLKSGMFAKVKLILQKYTNVPVVLKEAIIGKEPNLYVYVIENKKAVLRNVTLGIRQGEYYEIKEGLKQGDLVVIMGQQKLYEGAAVNVEME